MLSRVADSLYWMSRYLERAEHTTRLLDVNLNLMLDESSTSSDRRWLRLLQALGKPKRLKWDGNPYERRLLHHCSARERAACARADFHRAVAPAEFALSAGNAAGVQKGDGAGKRGCFQ
jgi:uncharacterized alpha-E superfamily protein